MKITSIITSLILICNLCTIPVQASYETESSVTLLDIDFSQISDIGELNSYGLFKDNDAKWYIENGTLKFVPSQDNQMFYYDISQYKNSIINVEFTQNLYIEGKEENRTCFGLSQNDTSVFQNTFNNSTLIYTKGNFNGDVRFQSSYNNIKNGCDTIKCVNTEDLCYAEDDGSYLANTSHNTCMHRNRSLRFTLDNNSYSAFYKDPSQNEYIPLGGNEHRYSADAFPSTECFYDSCDKYKYSYLEWLPNRKDMNYLVWYGKSGSVIEISNIKITASCYGSFNASTSENMLTVTFDDVFCEGAVAYLNGVPYELSDNIKYDKLLTGYSGICETDSSGKHNESISLYTNTPYVIGSLLTLDTDTLTEECYTLTVPAYTLTRDGLTLQKELSYTFYPDAVRSDSTLIDFDSTYSSQLPSDLKKYNPENTLELDDDNNIIFCGSENEYFYYNLNNLGNDVLTVEMTMDGNFSDTDTRFFTGLGTNSNEPLYNQLMNHIWLTQRLNNSFIFANTVTFNNWEREINGTKYTNKTFLNSSEDYGDFSIIMKLYPDHWSAQYSYGNNSGTVEYGLYLNRNVQYSADRILSDSTLVPEENTYHLMEKRIRPEFLAFGFASGENVSAKISHLRITRRCASGGESQYISDKNEIVYSFDSPILSAKDIYITDGEKKYTPEIETLVDTDSLIYRYIPESEKSYKADYRTINGGHIILKLNEECDLNKNYKLVIPASTKTVSGLELMQTYTIDCIPVKSNTEYAIFEYDIEKNYDNYDHNTLKCMNNVSISADNNGLSILNNNQDFKYWAAVPLKDIGTNAIHLKADLSIKNSSLNNIFFGLTDGNYYRLDAHNTEENGSLLHILNIFYNANDASCSSDGNMVYALSGANNGWTSKLTEGLGENRATFNNKTHGMKHIAAFDNSRLDDISLDILLTPYGWSGTLSAGENSKYIDYIPYSYAYGKAWYKMWNTPSNLVISTKLNNNQNANVFKKLSVSLVPYENFSIHGNTIYTSFDAKLLENAIISDSTGKEYEFSVSPWEDTASWVNAGGDGGAVKSVNLGSKINISNSQTSDTYKISIPQHAKNSSAISLGENFVHTFMLNETENIFAFNKYNTVYTFSPVDSMSLTAEGALNISEPSTIPVNDISKNLLKIDFECTPDLLCNTAFKTQSGTDLLRIITNEYNGGCITKVLTASEIAASSYGTTPSKLSGEVYISQNNISGYIRTNNDSFTFADFSQNFSDLQNIITASGIVFDKLVITKIPDISVSAKYDHTQNKLTYTINTPLDSSAKVTVSDGENSYPVSLTIGGTLSFAEVILVENADMTKTYTLLIPEGTLTVDGEALTADIKYSFRLPQTEILSYSLSDTSLETTLTYRLVNNDTGEYIENGHIALVGMYDENDSLISVFRQEMTQAQLYRLTFAPPSKPKYIKLFMWKDLKTMLPLSDYLYHN